MAFYLGIDGGGTKTKFLLGDEQRVLAEAFVGGSNILRSGEAAVRAEFEAGLRQILQSAGVNGSQVLRTVAGVAGSSNEKVRDSLGAILGEQVTGEIVIVGDMVIAHQAAFEGGPGILVNAGTGSIAYGKNARAETARAGGWGFQISDEGSGYWIGRLALVTAMRRYDTGESDGFLNHLMAALGATQAEELAAIPARMSMSQIFPFVVSIAQLGDEVARAILKHAGEELVLLAETLLARLFADVQDVRIAAIGGVFGASEIVYESFAGQLRSRHPGVTVWASDADAAMGALTLAREARG